MTPWDEPYDPPDDELDDAPTPYVPEPDAVTAGVGGSWYVAGFTLDECRQTFQGSALTGGPERFDRYYVHTEVGPLLVDILVGDGDEKDAQAARKHVAFKRRWCEANDRRYLVLTEDQTTDASLVRTVLQGAGDAATSDGAPTAAKSAAPKPRRGRVQRPKATA